MPRRQLRVGRDDAELLLPREHLLAQRVPALVETALVLVGPLERNMVRRVRRPGGEVDEERPVGRERALLADPTDRAVGHVLGEVVALLRCLRGLDRRRPLPQRRVVLVRLATDEPEEVLEAAATRGPGVERPHRARLPHRYLVALPELRGRVAVQLQHLGERRHRLRADRRVPGRRGRDLGDTPHPRGVMVAPRQQRLPRRRAQSRRVEAVEPQTVAGEPLRGRCLAWASERARRPEADVVEQHHEDVRRSRRRAQRLDRRKHRRRILRVERQVPFEVPIRNRQRAAVEIVGRHLVLLRTRPRVLFDVVATIIAQCRAAVCRAARVHPG
jgi:hypothetical protein